MIEEDEVKTLGELKHALFVAVLRYGQARDGYPKPPYATTDAVSAASLRLVNAMHIKDALIDEVFTRLYVAESELQRMKAAAARPERTGVEDKADRCAVIDAVIKIARKSTRAAEGGKLWSESERDVVAAWAELNALLDRVLPRSALGPYDEPN